MLIGFGCTVPAVMATRTLSSERDRNMTIMLTPFMSCSAKIPIYTVFAAAFFPGKEALVMILLYDCRNHSWNYFGACAEPYGISWKSDPVCDGTSKLPFPFCKECVPVDVG